MPAPISASTTARAREGAAQVARSARRASAAVSSARSDRDQVARVDRMVNGMETLEKRISSNRLNGAQRTVSVARFNDLQRRVNRMDGIVVGEGRGDRSRGNVGRAMVARQTHTPTARPEQRRASEPTRSDNEAAAERSRNAERARAARRTTQANRSQARRRVEIELRRPEPPKRERVAPETVESTREGIGQEGLAVVGERPDNERVVDLLT